MGIIIALLPALSFAGQVDRIEQAYSKIKDVTGTFIQESVIKDLDSKETYNGEFYIMIPSKVRWSYTGKEPQDVYINGESMLIYQKDENQAFRSRFDKQLYGQAPVALLGGLGNIARDFDVTEQKGMLLLKPKNPMGNVSSVEIEPSKGKFPIKSLKITDTYKNTIKITLKDVKVNTSFSEKVFDFTPPEGTAVYEQ